MTTKNLFTGGHGGRDQESFLESLQDYDIEVLVGVWRGAGGNDHLQVRRNE